MGSTDAENKRVNLEVGRGGPDVAVVAADDRVLDHLGAEKLVVDVALPTHAAENLFRFRSGNSSKDGVRRRT
jgi:hypothetical protein